MRLFLLIFAFFLASCSMKKNYTYLNKIDNNTIIESSKWDKPDLIQINDVLDVKITSDFKEVSVVYNKNVNSAVSNFKMLPLEGYLVNENHEIELPVIGLINVKGLTIYELKKHIRNKLIDNKQLTAPIITIRRLNSKFTVLGEVLSPGTFHFVENKINIFQALGYAGDITISGKKNKVKLIRMHESKKEIMIIDLTSPKIVQHKAFYIKNNDVLIVQSNFSKLKSAGFIGNTSSITSIASMIVSISILLLNN